MPGPPTDWEGMSMLSRIRIALAAMLIAFGIVATLAVVTTINSHTASRPSIIKRHVG